MKTGFEIKGAVTLSVERADGSVVSATTKNLATDWGLQQIATFIAGGAAPKPLFTNLAMGDDNTAPAETQTALVHETERHVATVTHLTGTDSHKVEVKVSHALGSITGTFKEAGLFDAGTGGNMFNRSVFADFPVTVSDTLTVIWLIEVKNI